MGSLTGTLSAAGAPVGWKTWQATTRYLRDDVRGEIREFLTTRRARITPSRPGSRCTAETAAAVPGLRRDEVAVLAGISSQYYTRLERGNATGVSESIIDSLARALQLDEAERTHLLDLIRTAGTTRAPRLRPHSKSGPRCSASWIPWSARQRSCSTDDWKSWPPTSSGSRSSPRSTLTRPSRPAAPVHLPRPVRDRVLPGLEQGRH